MRGTRPPLLTVLSAGALSVTVLAGCNASSSSGGGGDDGAAADGPALILITPEPVGVNPFLQLAVDGVEQAAQDAGGEARIFESQDPTNIQQQMDAAVADAPDVLAVVGFEFADSVAAAATANPEQQFLFVDACTAEEFDNVTCAVFREHEGVYLAGVEAGLLSAVRPDRRRRRARHPADPPLLRPLRRRGAVGQPGRHVHPALRGRQQPVQRPGPRQGAGTGPRRQGRGLHDGRRRGRQPRRLRRGQGRRLPGLRRRRQPVPGRARPGGRQRHQGGRRRHRRQHRRDPRRRTAAAWCPTAWRRAA